MKNNENVDEQQKDIQPGGENQSGEVKPEEQSVVRGMIAKFKGLFLNNLCVTYSYENHPPRF